MRALQPPDGFIVLHGLMGGACAAQDCEPFSQQWADLSPAITSLTQPGRAHAVNALRIP